ncbi:MAG TPA: DUF72 domain-containing protein [Casimicrobiaceae bacterium]|jgi:uncharacterized protein YecE (DUF72 family)|nr:DUF72 domain-containing protein [Casimicrobiaceae bacterium]
MSVPARDEIRRSGIGTMADRVRVGLCGFTMAMKAYATLFPVVEIQTTFYEPPGDATLLRWRRQTSPALEYTIKVWQLVTHRASSPTYRRMKAPLDSDAEPGGFRNSVAVAEGWRRSVECANVLGATGMLFQCPSSFGPTPENVRELRGFFERIDRPSATLLWEPRGKAWVAEREMALALCRDLQLTHVVDPFVTAPSMREPVYWRLHGPGGARNSYSDTALRHLHAMLLRVETAGPHYVLFNNLPRLTDAKRFSHIVAMQAT